MSAGYRAIGWTRHKRIYDAVLASGVLLSLACFVLAGGWAHPDATIETLLIRGLGTTALLLLHVILSIGPLCRLSPRFLPLLYNRRHLGVTMFLVALAHGIFSIVQFHAFGDINPIVSVLTGESGWGTLSRFPFQPLGLAALVILLLMAATSHDFWLANLTAPVWKGLHMAVYGAYGLVVMHVALGAVQGEGRTALAVGTGLGLLTILGLHIVAGVREARVDAQPGRSIGDGLVDCGPVGEIAQGRARVVCASGERIAVFRHEGRIHAVSNVCKHQNGPLGEGRIVDGCITCPWHGYQYLPGSGRSPAPFDEKIPTFQARVIEGRIWVDPRPFPPGTEIPGAPIAGAAEAVADPDAGRTFGTPQDEAGEFYIGYRPAPPGVVRMALLAVPTLVALVAGSAGALALLQGSFTPANFEFGVIRSFEGLLVNHPYPSLRVAGPGGGEVDYPLVAPGKFGASRLVDGLDGRPVRIEGSLIHRQGRTMIEIAPHGVAQIPAGEPPVASGEHPFEDLGVVTLDGEIVDSKCFLGVMNPGNLRPHRACAIRCISGGIPPMLHVRDASGRALQLLLLAADGSPVNRDVLTMVAEPVRITGRAERRAGQLYLYADPSTYLRLSGD